MGDAGVEVLAGVGDFLLERCICRLCACGLFGDDLMCFWRYDAGLGLIPVFLVMRFLNSLSLAAVMQCSMDESSYESSGVAENSVYFLTCLEQHEGSISV